jgi:hypothetical protein
MWGKNIYQSLQDFIYYIYKLTMLAVGLSETIRRGLVRRTVHNNLDAGGSRYSNLR